MSSDDPTGPSNETLRALHGALPSMMKGLEEKKIGGKGVKVQAKRPRKMCKVCCTRFDFVISAEETILEPGVCERCQKMLDQGCIAFTCGEMFVFGKSESMKDMAGEIHPVSAPIMERLKSVFKDEWSETDQGHTRKD